jgi:hypothetical protein
VRTIRAGPDRLFFIGRGRTQIRGVNHRHGPAPGGYKGQQLLEQMLINDPQTRHASPRTELKKHPHIRSAQTVREPGKAPPSPLFRQQTNQGIEAVRRRQQRQ